MTTIADLQKKFLDKLETKTRKGMPLTALLKKTIVDAENLSSEIPPGTFPDPHFTESGFRKACELVGPGVLTDAEFQFLFAFWDTRAGEQESMGAVPVELAMHDLKSAIPEYGGFFKSGDETLGKAGGGNKSNKSSMQGGIFGGGSYEADANADRFGGGAAALVGDMAPPAARSDRPRGNQSSIPGGIFGENTDMNPPPSSRSNRSNQSSIPGGIFGEAGAAAPPGPKKYNSNASSIPGGIFG